MVECIELTFPHRQTGWFNDVQLILDDHDDQKLVNDIMNLIEGDGFYPVRESVQDLMSSLVDYVDGILEKMGKGERLAVTLNRVYRTPKMFNLVIVFNVV